MSQAAPKNTLTYGTGGDLAQMVLLPLPREQVARWLPAGVSLDTPPWMGGDDHPVLFLWSAMQKVGVWPIPRLFLNMTYLELGVGVPWTRVEDGNLGYTGPAFYTGLFYVEDGTALWLGNVAGSLPKFRASLSCEEGRFRVRQERNDHLLAELNWTRGEATPPQVRARVLDAMCQPLVTRKPKRYGGDIAWYGMRWGLDQAPMHDIDARGSHAGAFLNTELLGASQAFAVSGSSDPEAGIAVESQFSWHLNGPVTDGAQLPLYRPA